MDPCVKCGAPGHIHHIVFRSHGGLDNDLNLVNLCPMHHELGPDSPHRSREVDIELKVELQEKYFELFKKENYTIDEITSLIGISRRKTEDAFRKVRSFGEFYNREDIVRRLMGGRLY